MKLLLVDAGNARVKWIRREAAEFGALQIADYGDDGDRAIAQLCAAATDDVDAIVVSNVAGARFEARLKAAAGLGPRPFVWFARSARRAAGVRNAYIQPERLGVDRWAALVGAWARARADGSPAPVCVVDAGTALTIDALKSDGTHLGGLILPGLRLQRTALFASTAGIGEAVQSEEGAPQGLDIFATDTAQALARSGAFACAAAIDRCVHLLNAVGQRPRVMLCGGDASLLAPWLATGCEICPNLVFEGLAILFEQRSSD